MKNGSCNISSFIRFHITTYILLWMIAFKTHPSSAITFLKVSSIKLIHKDFNNHADWEHG